MITKEEAKRDIKKLVDRFAQKSPAELKTMNEETVKKNYILPLFKSLGWDVDSDDVSAEEGISKKRVDYGFKINGMTKFFLEAKKPSEGILDDTDHIRQAINYSYWKSVTWAILTNFKDLVVFNAEWKNNNLSENRFITLNFKEFIEKFDKLWLLSTESFTANLIDEEATTVGKKQKREPIGKRILDDLIEWRELLTKNINKYDHSLDQETLDEAVQRILDRLIFIKSCEDRGIEAQVLLPKSRQWEENWRNAKPLLQELNGVFRYFDGKYNSKLFEPHICETLRIDNEVINQIIKELNSGESGLIKYDFSVIPSDILGTIYEQYLGHILQKSQKSAKVIEKHVHRKEQGIYYTPTYIVDYIVKNTVYEYAKNKTLDEVLDTKILDPACGSGSFLIRAYSAMLEIVEGKLKSGEKSKKWINLKVYSGRLNLNQKITILTSCIHGVDLDKKAVEIAQLNLLLKLLEGESTLTLSNIKEVKKLLPMLTNNIKCGNSLIDNNSASEKAFIWNREFSDIIKDGGFNIVIGNPPYIRIQTLQDSDVQFLKKNYKSALSGNYDIYVVFVERGLNLLNKDGLLGFILPHKFFNAKYGEPLRSLLSQNEFVSEIVHFGDQQIFEGATTYTCLLFLRKCINKNFQFTKVDNLNNWITNNQVNHQTIKSTGISNSEWNFAVGESSKLFEKLNSVDTKLKDVANRIYQGLITSSDTIYLFKEFKDKNKDKVEVFSQELQKWVTIESEILKPVIRSGSIGNFWAKPTALVLFPYKVKGSVAKLISKEEMQKSYPLAWEYLLLNKKTLEGREKGKFKDNEWFRFGRTQNLGLWEQTKILVPYMITKLSSYLDISRNYYFINVTTGGYGITIDESKCNYYYLCALLNSKLLDFYLKCVSTTFHGGYFAANKQYIENLPIKKISSKKDIEFQNRIIELVKDLLKLKNHWIQIKDSKTDEFDKLESKITNIETEINDVIYALYEITEKERLIIEKSK